EWSPTDYIHRLLVESLTSRGAPAPEGSEIGVFTPEGTLSGAAFWTSDEEGGVEFNAYGDDPETEVVEGFHFNERFEFRVWDNLHDLEWSIIQVEFLEGPETWQQDEMTRLTLDGRWERTLSWSLNPGWNMVSFNVFPADEYWEREEGPDLIRLAQNLIQLDEEGNPRQPLHLIKDFDGRLYVPDRNFLNIPYWNLAQSFALYLQEAIEVEWSGVPIPFDQPIQLTSGWNWVAYYPNYALSVAAPDFYVLAPLGDRLLRAKDLEGRFCSPAHNYSNMSPWAPGKGYMVLVSEGQPVDFSYPPARRGGQAAVELTLETETNPLSFAAGETMSLLVNSISGEQGVAWIALLSKAYDNDVYIIAKSVEGRIVGQGKVDSEGRCGLAIRGDDPSTPQNEGLQPLEAFALFIGGHGDPPHWNSVKGLERPLQISAFLQGEGLVYIKDALTVVEVVIADNPPENLSLQAHPNPFNQMTRLSFRLNAASLVQISIFDVQGRRIKTLLNKNLPAGSHDLVWEAAELPGGIYIAALETNQGRLSEKMLMLK
ncbi:MAG: T9SS type A sorting domain-containing protein, partial [Calditrichota bacterium]